MQISIVVPVYCSEKHISDCVKSILAQKYSDFELLLIDDGSPDSSGRICDEYAEQDNRIQVLHKPNGGVSSARNAGLEMAKGDYIFFVDCDDYIEPDYISAMVSAVKERSGYGHIWCCFQTVTGYQYENAVPNLQSDEPYLIFDRAQIMDLHQMWLDTGPCNKLYRRSVLMERDIRFPEDLSLGEDWLFNLAYLDAVVSTKILVITKPLYNYVRSGKESLDEGYRPDMLEIYQHLNRECHSYLNKWNVSSEQMRIFYNSKFYSYEKVLRNTLRAPDKSRRILYNWNSKFMRSHEFQEILQKRDCWIHPLYFLAYRLGSYRLIALLNQVQGFKNRIDSALFPRRWRKQHE